jgi:glycosyltransferase involved in cell wall biosynthesis
VVGPDEQGMLEKISHICAPWRQRVRQVDFTDEPESYMAASDIFCLPSYREGFGLSVIEASSCGLPTVASRIYGLIDAVADGETGFLFETGDISALSDLIGHLAKSSELRIKMGLKARERTIEYYKQEILTEAMKKFLKQII